MGEKLTWEEIKKQYDQEWVELVDYDWPDGESHPRSGTLRSHAADKKEFHQQCRREPVPDDSAAKCHLIPISLCHLIPITWS